MTRPDRPPVLLTLGDYYGTLAAARCLGRAGVRVTLADSRVLAPTRWSAQVDRTLSSPHPHSGARFIEWLLELGEREPGQVLLPTSDEVAWLYALHAPQLSRRFRLHLPPVQSLYRLLNKRLLHAACLEAGVDTPVTHSPDCLPMVDRIARAAAFPVLIKPQAQICFPSRHKGVTVERAEQLLPRYIQFVERHRYTGPLRDQDRGVEWPLIQAYHPRSRDDVYSLAGYLDQQSGRAVLRAARKVLQRPRRVGIGLCFEEAPVLEGVAGQLLALCARVGYHGVFEVELIRDGDRHLLIDFNPRFYGQMALEIGRGLPLPLLAYEAAIGEHQRVQALLDRAQAWTSTGAVTYRHRFLLEVSLGLQRLAGAVAPEDVRSWRSWVAQHGPGSVDAVADEEDRLPAWVDAAAHLAQWSRHPRAFVRSLMDQ